MILFEAQSCDVFNVDENHYSKGSVQEEKKQSLMETIYVCHRLNSLKFQKLLKITDRS